MLYHFRGVAIILSVTCSWLWLPVNQHIQLKPGFILCLVWLTKACKRKSAPVIIQTGRCFLLHFLKNCAIVLMLWGISDNLFLASSVNKLFSPCTQAFANKSVPRQRVSSLAWLNSIALPYQSVTAILSLQDFGVMHWKMLRKAIPAMRDGAIQVAAWWGQINESKC